MKRRTFLELGAIAGLGLALRGSRAARTPTRPAKRLLTVFAAGGWDTTWSIEPKDPAHADQPPGHLAQYGGLDVYLDDSRPRITGLFERHADNIAIVRGIATDGVNHLECQRRITSGTREATRPDLGAMVAHELGRDLPVPYLILGNFAATGPYAASSARLGATNQIITLLGGRQPQPGVQPLDAVAPDLALEAKEAELLRAYADASVARARAERGARGYNRRRVDDFAEGIDRGDRLRAFRDRFGTRGQIRGLETQIPIALDALEQDLAHAVSLETKLPWDTHQDNYTQGELQDKTFGDVAVIVDELKRRPGRAAGTKMIDDTIVLVFSEMARGPRQSGDAGHEGKGHWTNTSALVIGGGVKGGRVFGSTTADSTGMKLDLATGLPSEAGVQPMYSHFVAGMLAVCGVDPDPHFPTLPVFDAFGA